MAIKYKIEVTEDEYFDEIGFQLVYLNKFLFQTQHEKADWKSYVFPCIKDAQGNLINWKSLYGKGCLLANNLLRNEEQATATNLSSILKQLNSAPVHATFREKCQAADFLLELQSRLQQVHPYQGKEVDAILSQMFKDEQP